MFKKKILVYSDGEWSIGRINKSIEKWTNNEYEFTFYDWAKYNTNTILSIIDNYDIILTNLCCIDIFKNYNICLKKFIFSCHGYPELIKLKNFEYPKDTTYTITSEVIRELFPKDLNLLFTPSGIEPINFNFVQRSGEIKKIGWCGGLNVPSKRVHWTKIIANLTNLEYEIQSKLSYDEIKNWYNTIDILLVNAGPESWNETGPLPPFEAVVSGVLVIGTHVGNFLKISGPKYNTVEEAIIIINELKKHPEQVLNLMKIQYDYVMNNWTYENSIHMWKNAFTSSLKMSLS